MPGWSLSGLLADPHLISLADKQKRDGQQRALGIGAQATAPVSLKENSGPSGFEVLSNAIKGLAKTGNDLNNLNPVQQLFNVGKDIVQGDNPIPGAIQATQNPLSGRRYAENFGAGQQFNRMPELAQTVADVAPQAALAVATGGVSEAPQGAGLLGRVGLPFAKSLATNTAISLGLQKGSEAAQDLPGWRALSPDTQNALITGATVVGGMATHKALTKVRMPTPEEIRAAKMGAQAGLTLPVTGVTRVAEPGDNMFHGSPQPLEGNALRPTPAGDAVFDMGPGPYVTPDAKYANYYTQERSPETGFAPGDAGSTKIPSSPTGSNISRWTPKENLNLLDWAKPVLPEEQARVEAITGPIGAVGSGGDLYNKLALKAPEGQAPGPFVRDILQKAGFDGFHNGDEQTVWNPDKLQSHSEYANQTGNTSTPYVDPAVAQAYSHMTPEQLDQVFSETPPAELPGALEDLLTNDSPQWVKDIAQEWKDNLPQDNSKNLLGSTALSGPAITPSTPQSFPTIGGGASKWKSLFGDGLVPTANNTIRGMHTLFDLATFGRLGPQVALRNPGEYKLAIKAALKGLTQGREPVKEAWAAIDAESAASGGILPTTADWRKYDLSLHTPSTGLLQAVPGLRNVANMYQNFLDVLRPQIANEELRNRLMAGDVQPGDVAAYKQIAKGTNLLTGQSSIRFGKEGSLLVEFPNWLAAQGELITKAFTSGQIDGQMARSSLLRLVGMGTLATYVVNAVQEGTASPNALLAHTRNGIPQANIPGTKMQVDMFGPLGELISKINGIGVQSYQGAQANGPAGAATGAYNGLTSAARGFASPVAKIGTDILSGSTATGERVSTPEEKILDIIDQALPFSSAEAGHAVNAIGDATGLGSPVPKNVLGTRSATAGLLGNLGLRVHEPSLINRALADAGISQSDPDYLIKRKEFLLKRPDIQQTNDVTDTQQRIQAQRQQLNDMFTAPGSSMSTVAFRDNRTRILQNQRDTLAALLGDKSNGIPASSQQGEWLKSYNALFDQAKNPNDPSGLSVSSDLLDPLVADWTNKNGTQALDFVNRYTLAGLGPAETAYITDLRKLSADGYFDAKSNLYTHMQSNLTPAEIDNIHFLVEADRLKSPNPPPFAVALAKLRPDLTAAQRADIVNSTKAAFQSPALKKLKADDRKELLWFNPRATWDTYQGAQAGAKAASSAPSGFMSSSSGSSSGGRHYAGNNRHPFG